MILRRFSGLPVRRKLMLIVFLASGGALLLANAALVLSDVRRFRDDMVHDLEILGEVNNVAYGMPGDDMGVKLDMIFVGLCSRPLHDRMKASRRRPGFLAHLLDKFRHVIDLFHAHHVELGAILSRDLERQGEGMKRRLGAVVGMQDLPEHSVPLVTRLFLSSVEVA